MTSGLHKFQEAFGRAITTPFDFSGEEAAVQPQNYPPETITEAVDSHIKPAILGVAVYNEQYWFRLLTTMQKSFPLVEKLMGTWHFNQLVTAYLTEYPPDKPILNLLGEKLTEFILKSGWSKALQPYPELTDRDCRTLSQAAALDFLFGKLLFEPDTSQVSEDISSSQPMLKPGVALFREESALLKIRNNLTQTKTNLKQVRKIVSHYVIYNSGGKVLFQKLTPLAFRLLTLIQRTGNLDEGLAEAERCFSRKQKAKLQNNIEAWFKDWGRRGWFFLPTF